MSVHSYDLNEDFSGAVFFSTLKEEIDAAGLPSIGYTQQSAEAVILGFDDDLSASQITTLDGVVAAHSGEERVLRIYDLVHNEVKQKHFHDINYKTELMTKLQPERIFSNKGELTTVNWYDDFDGSDFGELVLSVGCVYSRNAIGYADFRTTTRTWYYSDGSAHPETKVTVKWYPTQQDKFGEAQARRSNNIQIIQTNTLAMMMQVLAPQDMSTTIAQGQQWMRDRQSEIVAYKDEGHTGLHSSVSAATDTWLDMFPALLGGSVTIRNYILGELA